MPPSTDTTQTIMLLLMNGWTESKGITDMSSDYDKLEAAAAELGREAGHNAGTWVIDGNTTVETARKIPQGYEDGDPEVMDMQPSPLSGEWADDPTIQNVLDDIASEAEVWEIDPDSEDDLLIVYENSYSDGYWHEVIRAANAVIGKE